MLYFFGLNRCNSTASFSRSGKLFIKPRVSDGCNSFDIVFLSVCLSDTTLLNRQTYKPEFWYVGPVEEYLGQGQRSRSPGQKTL